jgi:hypothetical protein
VSKNGNFGTIWLLAALLDSNFCTVYVYNAATTEDVRGDYLNQGDPTEELEKLCASDKEKIAARIRSGLYRRACAGQLSIDQP